MGEPVIAVTPEQRQRIQDALRDSPSQMTLQLARRLGVPEVEVIRAMPDGRAVELDAGRWEELLRIVRGVGQGPRHRLQRLRHQRGHGTIRRL